MSRHPTNSLFRLPFSPFSHVHIPKPHEQVAHSLPLSFTLSPLSFYPSPCPPCSLDYPGIGPEHSFLKDAGRCEYYAVTDQEALDGFQRLSQLEGIVPALETSHAIAYLEKLCPTLKDGTRIVLNCSGRGDKDVNSVIKYLVREGCVWGGEEGGLVCSERGAEETRKGGGGGK